jgi:hypothetical protein
MRVSLLDASMILTSVGWFFDFVQALGIAGFDGLNLFMYFNYLE